MRMQFNVLRVLLAPSGALIPNKVYIIIIILEAWVILSEYVATFTQHGYKTVSNHEVKFHQHFLLLDAVLQDILVLVYKI